MTFWGPEKLPSPDDPEAAARSPSRRRRAPTLTATGRMAMRPIPVHGHDSHFGHESPPVMTIPLAILAVCAVLVGFCLFGPFGLFEHHLEQTFGFEGPPPARARGGASFRLVDGDRRDLLAGLFGLGLAYAFYFQPSPIPGRLAPPGSGRSTWLRSTSSMWMRFYNRLIVVPTLDSSWGRRRNSSIGSWSTAWSRGWPGFPGWSGVTCSVPIQNGLIQYYAAVDRPGRRGPCCSLLLLV